MKTSYFCVGVEVFPLLGLTFFTNKKSCSFVVVYPNTVRLPSACSSGSSCLVS